MTLSDYIKEFNEGTIRITPKIWDHYIEEVGKVSEELFDELARFKTNPDNKPKDMLDELKTVLGHIPGIMSRMDRLSAAIEKKQDKGEFLSKQDYVECEKCGNLVRKSKAQFFDCLGSQYEHKESDYFANVTLYYANFLVSTEPPKDTAERIYLCQHCDMKKFKKEHKIK